MKGDEPVVLKLKGDRRGARRAPSTGRRLLPRYGMPNGNALQIRVKAVNGEVSFEKPADLLDIGEGGASLVTSADERFVPGAPVILDFSGLDGWETGHKASEIRWIQPESDLVDLVLMGVQFLEPIEGLLERIPPVSAH